MKTNKTIIITLVFMLLLISNVLAIPSGAITNYDFNEGSGTTANDIWGTDDGTITGATYSATYPTYDVSGNGATHSILFDNTGEYVNMNNADTSTVLTGFSVCTWIYPDSLNVGDIVAGFSGGGGFRHYIQLKLDNGYPKWRLRDDGSETELTSATQLSAGDWYFLCGTWDGTTTKLYVDTVEKGSSSFSVDETAPLKHYFDMYVGGNNDISLGINYEFSGKVDDFQTFSRALTVQEISDLYDCNDAEGCSPPATEKFQIICENSTSETVLSCNATVDEVFYSTTNGTINTGLLSNSTSLHTIIINANNYFDSTINDYNISSDLTSSLLHYPKVSLYNYITEAGINSWNVEINGTNYTSTSNEVFVPFNTTKDIKTFVTDYIQRTVSHNFIDQNASSINVYQSIINISLRQAITNTTISNWELYQNETKIAESTSFSTIVYLNAGNYSDLIMTSKTASFNNRNIDNIIINPLDEKTETIYIFLSELNITAHSAVTSNPIMNFTINISSYNHSDSRSFSTTTGEIEIPIALQDVYNISIDAYGYALYEYYTDIYMNESPKFYDFNLYTNNSIYFTLKDEETNELIIQTLYITLTGDETSYSYNTSTGLKYIDEIQDGNYSIKIWNDNYNPKYYTITVADRSYQTLTAYLSTDYETAIFTFKDEINSELLSNVFFTQSRVINGTWSVVATKYSDITGRIPTSYIDDTAYRITITKAGYESKTFNLDPFLFDTYTVYMTRESSLSNIPESDIGVIIDPTIFYEGINNLTITFISPYGSLSNYWINITYPSNNNYETGNQSQGEIFSIPINITSSNLFDQIIIKYHYETSLGFTKTRTFIYSIVPADMYQGTFMQNQNKQYGLGQFELIVILVIATLIIAGFTYALAGTAGAIFASMIVLAIAQKIGLIPVSALIITYIIGFVLIISAIKGGSS